MCELEKTGDKKVDDKKYLFVYGLLKRKQCLNLFLRGGFKFVDEAIIKNSELYNYCGSVRLISGKGKVYGEVYEILKPSLLFLLDKIEHNYNRVVSEVEIKNKKVKAFVYFSKYPNLMKENPNSFKIKSGKWGEKK